MSQVAARRLAWAAFFVVVLLLSAACSASQAEQPTPAAPGDVPAQLAQVTLSATPAATTAASTPSPAPTETSTPLPSPTSSPSPTATVAAPTRTGKASPPSVSAMSAVVIDEDSGQVLFDKNSHARTPPASVTKIMTALLAIEHGQPSEVVKVSFDPSSLDPDSTLMGIHPGDEVTLEDLLYGLMLPSGNDAALAIATYVAGSPDAFVALMNTRAQELGLKDTQYRNPHGLDASGHYSSAYDQTMLARYAMTHYPLFARLASAKYWEVKGKRPLELYNLNKLLTTYKGGDGVKVGYTDLAGKTYVGSATRNGHRVYVGLMKTENIWNDAPPLLDWAFANFTWPSQ